MYICFFPGFRAGSQREEMERRYGTLGRQPREQPPPYHILPRSSYLLIPQDTPDLLRYTKLLQTYSGILGYSRPTQVYLDTPGLLRYTWILQSYSGIPGYSRPTQVYQDTPGLLRYTRILQAYSGIPGYSRPVFGLWGF